MLKASGERFDCTNCWSAIEAARSGRVTWRGVEMHERCRLVERRWIKIDRESERVSERALVSRVRAAEARWEEDSPTTDGGGGGGDGGGGGGC